MRRRNSRVKTMMQKYSTCTGRTRGGEGLLALAPCEGLRHAVHTTHAECSTASSGWVRERQKVAAFHSPMLSAGLEEGCEKGNEREEKERGRTHLCVVG
jgi:hypothetical protein